MSDVLETQGWVDPTEITSAAQLISNMQILKAAFDALAGGSIDLTSFVPTFSLSDDGKHFVVTSGPTSVQMPFPEGFTFRGQYVVGAAYDKLDVFTYLGTAWIVGTPFTATVPATDTQNFCQVFCAGGTRRRGAWTNTASYAEGDVVEYPAQSGYLWWLVADLPVPTSTTSASNPLPSPIPPDWTAVSPATSAYWAILSTSGKGMPATQVIDLAQQHTQDVINETVLTELATLTKGLADANAAIAKNSQDILTNAAGIKANADNIAAINAQLGPPNGSTTGFPLTLEQPASTGSSSGGSTGTGGSGGTGSTGTGGTGTGGGSTADPGTTATSSAQQNNVTALGNYISQSINNKLAGAGAGYSSVSLTSYGGNPTTLATAQAYLDAIRSNLTKVNAALGTWNNAAINSLSAHTFPLALPSTWADYSTVAKMSNAITELETIVNNIDTDMGQANTSAIGSGSFAIAAGFYPIRPYFQAM